jgi:hypothetical protein
MGGKTRIPGQNIFDPIGAFVAREFIEKRSPKRKKRPEKTKSDPMMDYLSQMQERQDAQIAQAAEAQRQALLQSQMAAGSQAEQMGESSAQQQLATMGSMQSIRDANARLAAQQAQAAAGQQATGGGFDFNRSREEALANLGAAGGMLPTTPTNIPATNIVNPALSGLVNQGGTAAKRANMFSLPSSSDLKFGGV